MCILNVPPHTRKYWGRCASRVEASGAVRKLKVFEVWDEAPPTW